MFDECRGAFRIISNKPFCRICLQFFAVIYFCNNAPCLHGGVLCGGKYGVSKCSEMYSEPSKMYKLELFAKIVYGWKPVVYSTPEKNWNWTYFLYSTKIKNFFYFFRTLKQTNLLQFSEKKKKKFLSLFEGIDNFAWLVT